MKLVLLLARTNRKLLAFFEILVAYLTMDWKIWAFLLSEFLHTFLSLWLNLNKQIVGRFPNII